MISYEIIMKKRKGEILSYEELEFMVKGFHDGSIPDYQMTAFLMAAFIKDFNSKETCDFTKSIKDTGITLDLSELGSKVVDKHSTGGVGDKTTLVLVPLLGACGLKVAKISGRGLGHTGGTIDKLESVEGFNPFLSNREFIDAIKKIGISIISQTEELAPVEKKIYALRDVTATVDSIPFIASSIMSKKLAAGSNIIALDVKVGSGAFMKTLDEAKKLAEAMVNIGRTFDKDIFAVISDMNQPLGNTIGNVLEVKETINTLKGEGPEDLTQLCLVIGSYILCRSGFVKNYDEGIEILKSKLHSGEAIKKFQEMLSYQGKDENYNDAEDLISCLPCSNNTYLLKSGEEGYISEIDAEIIGKSSVLLGAGRKYKEDEIDRCVGLELYKKIGDYVSKDETLLKLYYNENSLLTEPDEIISNINNAYKIISKPTWEKTKKTRAPLIYEVID